MKNLFHLRFQSATDRLETPSEMRKASARWPGSRPSSANAKLAPEPKKSSAGDAMAERPTTETTEERGKRRERSSAS